MLSKFVPPQVTVVLCLMVLLLACSGKSGGSEEGLDGRLDGLTDSGPGMEVDAVVPEVIDPDAPVGLNASVSVGVDDQGVVHLFADNDEDLFFAQGYVVATHRLYSIDVFRRRATGRMAQWRGESWLGADKLMRTLGFTQIGVRNLAHLRDTSPADYRLMRAYVAGVNRRIQEIASGAAPLPAEYASMGSDYQPEPFLDQDVTAMGALLVFGFGAQMEFEILATAVLALMDDGELLPAYEPGLPVFIMESGLEQAHAAMQTPAGKQSRRTATSVPLTAEWEEDLRRFLKAVAVWNQAVAPAQGSNNWVVSGQHTDNGRPILASDPHVGYSSPNDLFLMHINSAAERGTMDVAGWAFPGIPGIQMGHNRHLAWAPTVNFADVADSWMVEVKDGKANVGGTWVEIESRTETILVRDSEGLERPEPFTVSVVPGFGVMLPDEVLPVPTFLLGKGSLLVNWVGFDSPDSLTLYNNFNRARNLEEFDEAALGQRLGIMNWIGASAEGWRYRAHGLVPDRGPANGRPAAWLVMDGSDPATFWTGKWLDPERTPHAPGDRPYLATANNDPWGHSLDGNPGNDEFYYGAYYLPGFRAHAIEKGLQAAVEKGGVEAEAMQRLQMDSHSTLAEVLLPYLQEAVDAMETEPQLAQYKEEQGLVEAAGRLLSWDREARRASHEAALFRVWYAYVARETLGDEMKLAFDGMEGAQAIILARFVVNTLRQQIPELMDVSRSELMLRSLSKAVAAVEERGGAQYTFGDLVRALFSPVTGEAPLPVPKDGDDGAVSVTQCAMWADGKLLEHCNSPVGAVFRAVYTFDANGTPSASYNMPEGNASTTEKWVEGQYQLLAFPATRDELPMKEEYSIEP